MLKGRQRTIQVNILIWGNGIPIWAGGMDVGQEEWRIEPQWAYLQETLIILILFLLLIIVLLLF